ISISCSEGEIEFCERGVIPSSLPSIETSAPSGIDATKSCGSLELVFSSAKIYEEAYAPGKKVRSTAVNTPEFSVSCCSQRHKGVCPNGLLSRKTCAFIFDVT